jgi:hypothetical protein
MNPTMMINEKVADFKIFHDIHEDINLPFKVESGRLYVQWRVKWIPLSQVNSKGKPYSVCSLLQKHGINLMRALNLEESENTEEKLVPWIYKKDIAWTPHALYQENDGKILMETAGGWICLREFGLDTLRITDEQITSKYDFTPDLDDFRTRLANVLYGKYKTKHRNIIPSILALEKDIREKPKFSLKFSLYQLAGRTYFEREGTEDVCSICSKRVTTNAKIARTECGHMFHADCIFVRLVKKAECPRCKEKVTLHGIIKKRKIDRKAISC